MIVSASRRTDIPAFYGEWFLNRIREGYVKTRNPMNPKQVSRIPLTPDVVDCISFWTKDPEPLRGQLEQLASYHYYFQYTLNCYGSEIEPGLRSLAERIRTFQELGVQLGKQRVVLRYDPILISDRYTIPWHAEQFERLLEQLGTYTQKCTISFLDMYRSIQKSTGRLGIRELTESEQVELAEAFARIVARYDIVVETCAERIDLSFCGIRHGHCVDPQLIEQIVGSKLEWEVTKGQRGSCGCAPSVDIGMYDSCPHGCLYCYANHSPKLLRRNMQQHDVRGAFLYGREQPEDLVSKRQYVSLISKQPEPGDY